MDFERFCELPEENLEEDAEDEAPEGRGPVFRVVLGIHRVLRAIAGAIVLRAAAVAATVIRILVTLVLSLLPLIIIVGLVILFVYLGVALQQQIPTSFLPSPTLISSKTPISAPVSAVTPTVAVVGAATGTGSGLLSVIVGGLIGIIGAVGGSAASYWLEGKREERRERANNVREALEWAKKGRKESLRRTDLFQADLRGEDLAGADLAFANLRYADLSEANLIRADLHGADLRDANLSNARLAGANLDGAKAWGANFANSDVFSAVRLPLRKKPPGRTRVFCSRLVRRMRRLEAPLRILGAYWRIWEDLGASFLPHSEQLDLRLRIALIVNTRDEDDSGRREEGPTGRALTMFACNLIMVALAVASVLLRGEWLMVVVMAVGIIALNLLLVRRYLYEKLRKELARIGEWDDLN